MGFLVIYLFDLSFNIVWKLISSNRREVKNLTFILIYSVFNVDS